MKKRIFNFIAVFAMVVLFVRLSYVSRNKYAEVVIEREKEDKNYEVTYIGDQQQTSFTTVVTVLFQFNKSKHSSGDYDKWSSTMLSSLSGPFVAFVDYEWAPNLIAKLAESKTPSRIYAVY